MLGSGGVGESQADRLSRFARVAKVFEFGPVGHRRPRSRTSVGTPALARRSAVTPPPKPVPTTTARALTSVVVTARAGDALATRPPNAAVPTPTAAAPTNFRRLRPVESPGTVVSGNCAAVLGILLSVCIELLRSVAVWAERKVPFVASSFVR
ncbi:hypothetical protein Ga0074812_11271 [Parafrankia irregularis]|uniref:Uncharacterized protein n=1 Tax=Parafrankia irregularis TaxID=795642 RepID=A0A0S4QPN9_9ACTN|nr:hypothetical protein Ga0074812_11271 [Parafrankia irregularis]